MACIYFGMGNTGKPNPASAFVEVLEDGTAIVLCGAADMGQGTSTTMAMIAAQELGLKVEDVAIKSADTLVTPDCGNSSASRQTYVSGNAVRRAAAQAKQAILEEAAMLLGGKVSDLETADAVVTNRASGKKITYREITGEMRKKGKLSVGAGSFNPEITPLDDETGQGIPFATYHYCTQVAEVEVDTETGEVEVLSVVAAHDVGRAINPLAVEGQIDGGVAMGIGFALMEEVVLDNGYVRTPTFAEYMLPTSLDVTAKIIPAIVEAAEPTGPYGAKGTGEPPTCPTGAAIANAVYNAVGVRIKEFPLTSERVYKALVEAGKQG